MPAYTLQVDMQADDHRCPFTCVSGHALCEGPSCYLQIGLVMNSCEKSSPPTLPAQLQGLDDRQSRFMQAHNHKMQQVCQCSCDLIGISYTSHSSHLLPAYCKYYAQSFPYVQGPKLELNASRLTAWKASVTCDLTAQNTLWPICVLPDRRFTDCLCLSTCQCGALPVYAQRPDRS